ncbi:MULTISPECIES: glycosyltransferase family 2 protein [unclassified Providencia]|uniref:glycosyltransferase family 2 protein n=1 Tax=unclassified Providencia TaxID=2633465 RepID=UPI00298F4A82|nr:MULTISPECIES: glycosyltransferase family 2 protein [unclassified Providencia]
MTPLVTVVIPSYNHSKYVIDSIKSIINQDYDNIELLIIDDGSTDNSVEIINNFISSSKITQHFHRFAFIHRENRGLCATLNEGLKWSTGLYFSPFASDDIALPYKISYLVEKIHNSHYSAVFGKMDILKSTDNIHTPITKNIDDNKIEEHSFNDLIMQKNIPSAPTALIKKSEITMLGGYPEDLKLEDWYLWLSLSNKNKKLATFSRIVTLYRDHPTNTTKNIPLMHKSKIDVLNKFSDNILYNEAINNTYYNTARALARYETFLPLKYLIKSKKFGFGFLLVLIKAFTPSFIIKLK